MELLFWLAFIGIGYSYFIYPLLLLLIRRLKARFVLQIDNTAAKPSMSLIITGHNEQARIAEKLENSLEIQYPEGELEIIFASDCSTDDTDAIVRGYADRGVRLVRADEHLGKEYAQKQAIAAARGELLVFSDVGTRIPENALQCIAEKFSDPRVGAVSSEDRFFSDHGEIVGEGAYVRYEMWLRRLETETGGLVGLSGSFFAARKSVCESQWDTQSDSDFNTALNCGRLDLVAISTDDVLGYYKDVSDPAREYQRKVRTVLRGITGLARQASVLNPFKFGLFAFKVFSHKLMRWAVPWFMLLTLASNTLILDEGGFYTLTLLAQIVAYALVFAAWRIPALQNITLVKLGFFFVQVNIAIADASLRYLKGERMVVWQPSKR